MKRMFVLLRRDLVQPDGLQTTGYFIAQACHAIAELSHRDNWDKYMIVLGVDNEDELLDWHNKLNSYGIHNSLFKEPDLNNQATSLATLTYPKFLQELKTF